jgi:threonine/homoserine/homoserine lactone efflux protein
MINSIFFVTLLITGIVFGFISSTPLGPINLLVAENYFESKKIKIKPFLVGVILIDATFAYLAFWGYHKFLSETTLGIGIQIIGAIAVIFLGAIGLIKLYKKGKPKHNKKHLSKSNTANFLKGAFLCGSNPGFIIYWMWVAGQIKIGFETYLPESQINYFNSSLINIGIILGDIIWFYLFIRLLKVGAKKMKSSLLFYLRLVISLFLVALGISSLFMIQ